MKGANSLVFTGEKENYGEGEQEKGQGHLMR